MSTVHITSNFRTHSPHPASHPAPCRVPVPPKPRRLPKPRPVGAPLSPPPHRPHRHFVHLLHHRLHLLELLQEGIYLGYVLPRPLGQPLPPRHINYIRIRPLIRRHRPDDRLDPLERIVADIDVLDRLPDPRDHP